MYRNAWFIAAMPVTTMEPDAKIAELPFAGSGAGPLIVTREVVAKLPNVATALEYTGGLVGLGPAVDD